MKQNEKRNSRKRGKTAILTESPYKNDLKMSLEIMRIKKEKKENKLKEKNKTPKKQLFKPTPNKKTKVHRDMKKPRKDSTSSEDDPDAKTCLYYRK